MFAPPTNVAMASGKGATATTPVAMSGILAASTILAVITYGAGVAAVGYAPSAWTAAAGTIVHATVDTTGLYVVCLWR